MNSHAKIFAGHQPRHIELKTKVSEISFVSIIGVELTNDHMSLIFVEDCQIGASSS
jgi:hypothetical protein